MHMKKFLLLTFVASLFAAGSAFAHCGACGAVEKAHDHAATAEKACCGTEAGKCCSDKAAKSECTKSCCKSECTKSCCGTEGKCCSADKAKCESGCTKDKAKDETAVAAPPACCPAGKSGKPA
jgi:hypothetical protein